MSRLCAARRGMVGSGPGDGPGPTMNKDEQEGRLSPAKPLILVLTGLSGSGKTVALRAMEDAGFTCVDNLPPQLIDSFVAVTATKGGRNRVALGIDIRDKDFVEELGAALPGLKKTYDVNIIFLEADLDVLIRRFKETRRPHPLESPDLADIYEAVKKERQMLLSLREKADLIIDTSPLTPHELRRQMITLYSGEAEPQALKITVISFGFKFGMPRSVDLMFDVRFLPNPHFIPEFKELSGLDSPVRAFVLEKQETGQFIERLKGFLDFLIPLFKKEGKAYLTIGVGCTGGKHRSVAIVERLVSLLRQNEHNVTIVHRDL